MPTNNTDQNPKSKTEVSPYWETLAQIHEQNKARPSGNASEITRPAAAYLGDPTSERKAFAKAKPSPLPPLNLTIPPATPRINTEATSGSTDNNKDAVARTPPAPTVRRFAAPLFLTGLTMPPFV
ncbi:hypothetical protein BJ508DRAFT_377170 [Ascobolus immersus RN42]|uniref:Uncharacterized protein n=1 Tax=Ascobolus immersus RN42 TaxID=1160509 RepID=A0A3N4I4U6_ASCIM|nr:hypothetical protein BJ508DRAFT_377170 [Ascobolus immersus RN42]